MIQPEFGIGIDERHQEDLPAKGREKENLFAIYYLSDFIF